MTSFGTDGDNLITFGTIYDSNEVVIPIAHAASSLPVSCPP
jgi:hypothetical protein